MTTNNNDGPQVQIPDFLKGLVSVCWRCRPHINRLAELNAHFRDVDLLATLVHPSLEPGLDKEGVRVRGPFALVCDQCGNTGLVPNENAVKIHTFISEWIKQRDMTDQAGLQPE